MEEQLEKTVGVAGSEGAEADMDGISRGAE